MTKRSPSYYKYKKEHPTVSFILTRELKEALDILKEDKSYGQTMKQIIEGNVDQEMSIKLNETQDEVLRLNEQLEYLRGVQRFEVPCRKCRQPMNFSSNSDQWKTKIYPALWKAFRTWTHGGNCPEEE
ncbi:MAG: hypothetical protein IBX40_10225 [Methanosarcinales archaeon]|nr:hypothetical protein [Methanosarcinales archaeon]